MQTIPAQIGDVQVLIEVVPVAGSQQTSVADRLAGAFDRTQAAIEQIAVTTGEMIDRLRLRPNRPGQIEVGFGLKISAKGEVIVAGTSGEASLQVTLRYDGAPARADAPVSSTSDAS